MQKLIWAIAVLFLAGTAWRYRDTVSEWTGMTPPPKRIVFDNGTVRQYDTAPRSTGNSDAVPLPLGALRKCVRGGETSYSNIDCPPGFKEKEVETNRVTVISGTGSTKSTPASPSNPQKTLRDALDLSKDDNLREKVMHRVIAGGSK